ncbi:MAG: type II secretion system protein GspF [Gammaproteobacteria bacterium]|nr:MAG: type II secretion system protein GspF [Gammaproteobacteria bacterium]
MGAFEYTIIDERGREKKGTIEGDTAKHARQKLREKGWSPISVQEITEKSGSSNKSALSLGKPGGSLSTKDLALVTRQLATLIKAALPLEEALKTAAQQSEKPKIKRILISVRSKVMEGHPLADGFAEFPSAFPDLYVATVRAGEQTGHLDTILERLADYTEVRQEMQQKVTTALIYPIALSVIAILVVVGLLTYVVPQIVEVFENQSQELPTITVAMIALSDFIREQWLILLLGFSTIFFGFSFGMRKEKFRYAVHKIFLKIPLIKKIVRGMNTGRFARTFSILTGSGVPILEGLKISSRVISNLPMRAAVTEATSMIREGAGIGRSLEQSKQFPPITINLISSGESSGKLEEMLDRAAINQEREIKGLIDTLLALLEPLLIVSMGGVVMLIVMAVLLPIFEMNQMAG